jgi:uncharacterized glyoxalase superfamily protein PhnB
MAVKPIPDGHHSVTPHLIIKGANEAIEFYKKAFGAQEVLRMPGPDGNLMHAEVKIGDSHVFLAEENPQWGALGPRETSPVTIHLYVEDVDKVYAQALAAGATSPMPVMDMFWGDRYGKVVDPFGHHWSIATHKQDLSPEQMMEGMKHAFASMGQCE